MWPIQTERDGFNSDQVGWLLVNCDPPGSRGQGGGTAQSKGGLPFHYPLPSHYGYLHSHDDSSWNLINHSGIDFPSINDAIPVCSNN